MNSEFGTDGSGFRDFPEDPTQLVSGRPAIRAQRGVLGTLGMSAPLRQSSRRRDFGLTVIPAKPGCRLAHHRSSSNFGISAQVADPTFVQPPDWIFAPVWTLNILMAFAA